MDLFDLFIGVCSNLLDETVLENGSLPAGPSSSSSIENISDNETENNDLNESPKIDFHVSSMTHLPDMVENKQNNNVIATSVNWHEKTTDNASVESSTAGESCLSAFQGEERRDSDCNKTSTAHSIKAPDKSSESFTSIQRECNQTDTDHRDELVKNRLNSPSPGKDHEKENKTQSLDNKINDKEGQKGRSDSPLSEAVGPPGNVIDEEAVVDDLSNFFSEKCSLNGL